MVPTKQIPDVEAQELDAKNKLQSLLAFNKKGPICGHTLKQEDCPGCKIFYTLEGLQKTLDARDKKATNISDLVIKSS